jgi:hypothetical protein
MAQQRRVHGIGIFTLVYYVSIAQLPLLRRGMDACWSAHNWARHVSGQGHDVRLIPLPFANAYVGCRQGFESKTHRSLNGQNIHAFLTHSVY